MISIWIVYVVAAAAASCVFIVAGRRSKQADGFGAARNFDIRAQDPVWRDLNSDHADASQQADAGTALRLAVKRLAPVMTSQFIQAEVAAPLGLSVRMRAGVLADLLEEMLAAAVHGAPASRILLAAAPHGDRVYITITDDMPGADATLRRAGVRGLIERVALRGGVLDVDGRPSEGTTMTLRVAAVQQEPMVFSPPLMARDVIPPVVPVIPSRCV